MKKYSFSEEDFYIDNKKITFQYPIEKVVPHKGIYLILLNPDSNLKKWGQFHNLLAINSQGEILWEAELPTTNTGDSYDNINISNNKINAYSWCSYICIIDETSGKITEKIFTK